MAASKLRALCCFRPCCVKLSATDSDDDEYQSVDSEPYSPHNSGYLRNVVGVGERLGKIDEGSGEALGCPHSSPSVHGGGEVSYCKTELVPSPAAQTQSVLSPQREPEGVTEISPQSPKTSGLSSRHSSDCVSLAETEGTQNAGSAMNPIESSKSPIRSCGLRERNPSFRWEHDDEEPYQRNKAIEFGGIRSGRSTVPKSSIIAHGQHNVYMSAGGGVEINRGCENLGWYIHVSETRQCMVDHHQLRRIMDELPYWSMQVPGTIIVRYTHTSGMTVYLPWPDLGTGSKHEIEDFVDTVNMIERRMVFYYLFMEHPHDQIFLSRAPFVPPPSPGPKSNGCVPPPDPSPAPKSSVHKTVHKRYSSWGGELMQWADKGDEGDGNPGATL